MLVGSMVVAPSVYSCSALVFWALEIVDVVQIGDLR